MAAIAVNNLRHAYGRDRKVKYVKLTWSGTYTAGGDAIALADLGLQTVDHFGFSNDEGSAGHTFQFDMSGNNKIMVFAGTTQFTGAITLTCRARVEGR